MVKRKKFSKELKLESVNLVLGRGVSPAEAARDLDINESVLSRWIRDFKQKRATGLSWARGTKVG